MEPVIAYSRLVDSLRTRIGTQTRALTEIAQALAAGAEGCRRADQASCIDALQEQVALQARWRQQAEEEARREFMTDKPGMSLKKAVATGLVVWITKGRDPVLKGIAVLKTELDRTAPFGNVAVTVGPGGIPDDVDVVSLSELARRRGISEAEATKVLEANGCRVVEPQGLLRALRRLKRGVLDGVVVLPVTGEQVRACLADGEPKVGGSGLPSPTVVAPVLRFRFRSVVQGHTQCGQRFHSS